MDQIRVLVKTGGTRKCKTHFRQWETMNGKRSLEMVRSRNNPHLLFRRPYSCHRLKRKEGPQVLRRTESSMSLGVSDLVYEESRNTNVEFASTARQERTTISFSFKCLCLFFQASKAQSKSVCDRWRKTVATPLTQTWPIQRVLYHYLVIRTYLGLWEQSIKPEDQNPPDCATSNPGIVDSRHNFLQENVQSARSL